MPFYNNEEILPSLIQFLDTNGDGTGDKAANVDYSSTSKKYFIQPPDGKKYIISEFIIHIADHNNFVINKFAHSANLVNGIKITVKSNGVVVRDLTNGEPIKTTAQLFYLSSNVNLMDFQGTSGQAMVVTCSADNCRTPLALFGNKNDTLEVNLNDDFSSLDDMRFMVRGAVLDV